MPPAPFPRRALIEELEPRLLFSADFAPGIVDALSPQTEQRVIGSDGEFANTADSQQAQHARLEVVFIDLRVQDYDKILADIHEQNTDGHSIEIVLLDSEHDGVAQIGEFLSQRQDIDAIHLISHGTAGSVQLGSGELNFDSLLSNAATIKQWGNALSSDADILIYGCDLASTDSGTSLINALGKLTGADVAASDDKTGASELGGDWILEYQTGVIQAQVAVSEYGRQNWDGVLVTYTVTNTNDTGAGSLRDALAQANASVGVADTIDFNISGTGTHLITPGSVLTITDAVTIDATTDDSYAANDSKPAIILDGNNGVFEAFVLTGTADGSTVRGFVMRDFNGDAIEIQAGSDGNTISGNYIGSLDTSGTSAGASESNSLSGVYVLGSNNTISDNVLSGNTRSGIEFAGSASGNIVTGNYIGTDATGTANIGNTRAGVYIDGTASNNIIGGAAGSGNLIANNGWDGIRLNGTGTGNTFQGNSIYGNTEQGIDIGSVGVTANDGGDADTGGNNLQNFPVLTSANSNSTGATIVGSLNSNADTSYRIEFFASRPSVADAANGEGERYLGFITVTTDGSGNATINATLANVWVNSGDRITATATVDLGGGNYGSTSEFAANVTATSTGIVVVDTTSDVADGTTTSIANLGNNRGADGRISLREAIAATNATANGGTPDMIVFAIPNADARRYYYVDDGVAGQVTAGNQSATTASSDTALLDSDPDFAKSWWSIQLGSTILPSLTQPVIIDASTQTGFAGTPIVEIDASAVSAGDPNAFTITAGGSTLRGFVINRGADDAIEIDSTGGGNIIAGNYIGTDVSGTLAGYGNGRGVNIKTDGNIVGGIGPLDRNVIGGSSGHVDSFGIGFVADANNNIVQGNYIGVGADGAAALGNLQGIYIKETSDNNLIGGTAAGAGNLIANSTADGIQILSTAGTGNAILGNWIYANGENAIDINNDGVTANDAGDADTGANNLQNFPVLYDAVINGTTITITGAINATANTTFRIEFFNNPLGSEDASGYGEGKVYLGAATVTTDGSGNAAINAVLTGVSVSANDRISSTSTVDLGGGTYGSTSEFSQNVLATPPANTAPTFNAAAFGGDGIVTTPVGTSTDTAGGMAVQTDGKIVVVGQSVVSGNYDFSVARYNVDGSLDTSFSGDGLVTTAVGTSVDAATSVALQADGKIVVAGYSSVGGNYDFAVVRYNSDGTLDTSFSGDGKLTTAVGTGGDYAFGVTVQADGKIVVTGYGNTGTSDDIAVVRYNSDGTLDTSFSGDGMLTTAIGTSNDNGRSVAVQADGKILVAGYSSTGGNNDFALVRFTSDGTLDTSFSGDGIAVTSFGTQDYGYGMTIQADGKILVVGEANVSGNVDVALARFNTDGALDTTFSGDGKVNTPVGTGIDAGLSVAVQANGKIVVTGKSSNGTNDDIAVLRYNSDGTLDTSFSGDGKLTTAVGSGNDSSVGVVTLADGAILVAGSTEVGGINDFALVRYNADGSLSTSPINTLNGAPTYTENGAPVVLDADVQVTDAELTAANNFSGATLTLARNGSASSQDVYSATGTLSSITATSGNVVVGGTTIGTYTNSGGTLVFTFNTNATNALVNLAMQQIAYSNSSDDPPASVQIDWTFNDGNSGAQGSGGALAATGSVTVSITTVNDTPVITSNGGGATASVSVVENITAVTTVTSSDIDGGTAVFSISGGADAGKFSINSGTGALSFLTAPDYENPTDIGGDNVYDVTVQVNDGNGGTDTQAIAVTVGNQAITTVSASGSATSAAGGVYTLNLNVDEDATSWTINWGDGTIETIAGDPTTATHTYAAANAGLTFNILVSATDTAGTHFGNSLIAPSAFLTGEGLHRYTGQTGSFSQFFSGGELTNPYAVIVGPDGLIYAAGHASDNIARYNAATGAYVDTFVAAGSGGLNAAAGLAFGPDGHLYVSNQIGDSVLKFDGTTGAFMSAFVSAGSGGLNAPVALTFRPDGYLYVSSYNTNSILRYNATTGAFVGTFVTAGSGSLVGPAGMAWGSDGNLYVASNDATVKRYNGTTGAFINNFVTTGSGGLGEAVGLAFGPDGNLYVSSYSTDKIIRYNGTTGALIGDYVTTGSGGLDGPTGFTFLPSHQVRVVSTNVSPVLDSSKSPTLASVNEDASAPVGAVGTLVSSLVDFASPAGQVDNVTDSNVGAQLGIAVTAADTGNGTWYFSTNGGTNWSALGAVSEASARLLAADANTRLYFQPNADWNGTITNAITFRAWDQTSGSNGGTADTSTNGGTTAFSAATDMASLTVSAVNDAPSLIASAPLNGIAEDDVNNSGTLVSQLSATSISDVDAGPLKGIAITSVDNTNGSWQYTLNGTTWLSVGSPSTSAALLLPSDATTAIRYVPNANYNGTSGLLYYKAWDQTTGVAGGTHDVTVSGGTTAFSSTANGTSVGVAAVNDAPVNTLASAGVSVSEDSVVQLLNVLSIADVDAGVGSFTVTLSVTPAAGTLSAASGSGVTVSGSGTSTLVLTGSLASINAYFASAATAPVFTAVADYNGAVSLTAVTNDNGNTGSGSALTDSDTSGGTISSVADIADDSVTTNEDTPVSFAPLSNDSFEDAGRTITHINGTAIATGGSLAVTGGTVTLNADSTLTFTPTANYNGAPSFTYTVTSGGVTETASVSVTVNPSNDAPIAADDRLALEFDGVDDYVSIADSASLQMTSTMTMEAWVNPDVSGNAVQIILNKEGENEMAIFADGSLNFAFAEGGVWSWHDTGADIARNTWTHIAISYDAGVVTTYVNGAFVDSQTLTTSVIDDVYPAMNELRIGGRTNNPTGQYFEGQIADVRVWNVARSQAEISAAMNTQLAGSEAGLAGYWMLDDNTGATAADMTANVNHGTLVNGADWAGYRVIEDGSLNVPAPGVLGNDYDADGDALSAIKVSGPAHGVLVLNADGSFTYTPDTDWHGTDSFTYKVNDGTVDSNVATVYITVDPVQDDPTVANPISDQSATEDAPFSFQFAANTFNDADTGDTLTYTVTGLPAWLSFDAATRTFSGTPANGDVGVYTLTVRATDGSGAFVEDQFGVTVMNANDAPVLSPIGNQNINEGAALTFTATASDADVPANTLTFSLGGAPVGATIDAATGVFNWTPTEAQGAGIYSFDVIVSDGAGGADSETITCTVHEVNSAPAGTDRTVTTLEDTSYIFTAADFGFTDPGDVPVNLLMAVKITTLPGAGSLTLNGIAVTAGQTISVADISAGWLAFAPAADANGLGYASLTFQVQDDGGTANGGVDLDPTPNTITLNVTAVNDAPTVAPINLGAIDEDGSLLITQALLLSGTNDVDLDSLTAINLTLTAGSGTFTDNGDGTWTFTPDTDWSGSANFSFDVYDGTDSTPNTASLVVNPVNDEPATSPVMLAPISEDSGPRIITQAELLSNASDVDGPALTAINLSITSGTGTLTDNGDGTWTYTPASNDDTSVTFSYVVTDGSLTTSGSAALDITPVNDAPTAGDISFATDEDNVYSGTLPAASDIDSALITYALDVDAAHGNVLLSSDGSFSYTPDSNYFGADTFSYTVSDGAGGSNTYTVTITVNSVNDAPTIVAPVDLGDINEDGSLVITQAMLLASSSDIESNPLTAINLTLTAGNGTLTDNGDSTWTFIPTADWNGAVSFGFDITDGMDSTSNTADLVVNPVNDAPTVALIDLGAIDEDGSLLITQALLLSGSNDVDLDSLTAINLTLTAGSGTLTDNGDGTWTFTPDAGWSGSAGFSFDVDDGTATVSNSATLIVDPVNDAPVIASNVLNISEGGTVVLSSADLSVSDVEQSAAQLTFTISNVTHGQFEWAAVPGAAITSFTQADIDAGLVVFVHDASDLTPSYDVSVSDGTTTTGPQAATITFTPVDEGINVTALSGTNTTEAGGTVTFDVALNTQPIADVTVFIASGNPAEGSASVSSLTFTSANWNIAQQITVTGVDDFVDDGDQNYAIQIDANSTDRNYHLLAAPGVALTNLDDDTAGILITPASGLVTDESGASDSFSVVLTSQPLANVVIGLSSSNTAEGTLSTYSLTFTAGNWNIPQVVTVTGVNDIPDDGDIAYQAVAAPASSADANYSGLAAGAVDVTNRDVAEPVVVDTAPIEPAPEPDPQTPPGEEAGAPQSPEDSSPPVTESGIAPALPEQPIDVDRFSTETAAESQSETALNAGLKSGAPLSVNNESVRHEVLTNPESQGGILLRLLEIIQADFTLGEDAGNRISPAIQVEIVQDEQFRVDILSQGAQITAVSLSVGAVWWALRAGGLFTSLLTSLPAWRSFDVLPVLSRDEDDDDNKDDTRMPELTP